MKFRFTVTLDVNELTDDGEPISKDDARQILLLHIEEAIAIWGGQGRREDLVWPDNFKSIKVESNGYITVYERDATIRIE